MMDLISVFDSIANFAAELSSASQFVAVLATVAGAWLLKSTKEIGLKAWVKRPEALGVLNGIFLAIGLSVVLVLLSGCTGTWMNDATLYAGLDHTKTQSTACMEGGPDDRTTSNMGLKFNMFESEDGRFRSNGKYTHHSCAFTEDSRTYDALGFELEYKLWQRK